MTSRLTTLMLALATAACPVALAADEVRVAVASNFRPVLQRLAGDFESRTGHELLISSGSTGKHYAQIRNGAPFDLFLAADSQRPARLETDGGTVPGSRVTYALGKLVLWSRDATLVDDSGQVLRDGNFRRLAIANPELAPYGRAARETLEALSAWEVVKTKLVRGENISQVFQ